MVFYWEDLRRQVTSLPNVANISGSCVSIATISWAQVGGSLDLASLLRNWGCKACNKGYQGGAGGLTKLKDHPTTGS